jgi:4-hydroxy-tetrahydrodipicolinate synthase
MPKSNLSPRFKVFPATEAALPQARAGRFAGCISATANLNADLCARFYRSGDSAALAQAMAIRKLFDGKPLVPGIKALLAHIHGAPQGSASRRRCRGSPRPTGRHRRLRGGARQAGGMRGRRVVLASTAARRER